MSGALPDAGDHRDARAADQVDGAGVPGTPGHPDGQAFDAPARALETGLLVASVAALRALGLLLVAVAGYGAGSFDSLAPLVVMVFDVIFLAWAALTAGVQFGFRSMPRPGRWALIVLAAPAAVLLVGILRSIYRLGRPEPSGLIGDAVLDAGILTVLVALGLAFSAGFLGREHRATARIAGALLALGGLFTVLLAWQAFEIYLTLFDWESLIPPADDTRYLVTAALALALLVGAIVFAAVSRRRGLVIASCIAGCLVLLVAVAAPVPADRSTRDPALVPDGGGGSSCSSDGDPKCIGE